MLNKKIKQITKTYQKMKKTAKTAAKSSSIAKKYISKATQGTIKPVPTDYGNPKSVHFEKRADGYHVHSKGVLGDTYFQSKTYTQAVKKAQKLLSYLE